MAITPAHVRYIKLGRGGKWVERALAQGEIHFGYRQIPHDICAAGRWTDVETALLAAGRKPAKVGDAIREIKDFYTMGTDCLWITFAKGHLWWAFAQPNIEWIGEDEDHGGRIRHTVGSWSKLDIHGKALRFDDLSTRLTSVAAYRQTICAVAAQDYLLRRINGIEEPVLARARQARTAMLSAAAEMIAGLHWADFEDMIDLIFARTGWQRTSELGGTQKDVDLAIYEPATGARGFVQVKSRATQAVLDDYLERYETGGGYDHLFFICHSPRGELSAHDRSDVHIWVRERLAEMAIQSGLYDWLLSRSA